jgi:diguanylate cyclase (GGDEF)-like protein/PAS domain S-box-containing protein
MEAERPIDKGLELAYRVPRETSDGGCDETFDDIARMASAICATPIAAVSLFDDEVQWFKSATGTVVGKHDPAIPLLARGIMRQDVMTVATDDSVGEAPAGVPYIRFCAGTQIVGRGERVLGSLYVLDFVPRTLTAEQERLLGVLAGHATALLDTRPGDEVSSAVGRTGSPEAAAASDKMLHGVIDSMAEGMVVQDGLGDVKFCNEAARRILEWSEYEPSDPTSFYANRNWIDENGADLPASRHPAMLTLADGQPRKNAVVGLRVRPDYVRWLSVNTSVIEPDALSAGERRLAVITFVDISERMSPHSNRGLLASAVESSDEAICTVDPTGCITSWNAGAERLSGYSPDEIVYRSLAELAPSDEEACFLTEQWTRVLGGEAAPPFETRLRRKDAAVLDVSIRFSSVRDASGRVIGISGVVRDITEQKSLIARLRKSDEMLSDAQELAALGMWELDVRAGRLIWSDEMFRIFGLSAANAIPTLAVVDAMMHPDDREAAIADRLRSLETGQGYEAERRVLRPDGTVAWFHVHTKVDAVDGRPVRMFGTVLDITDRKRIEHEVAVYNAALQAQMTRMEEVNKKLEELSTIDALTGLSNRRVFEERFAFEFKRANRQQTQLSLAMIDVDRFKQYNDDFGHLAGDEVLKSVARVIGDCVRETDLSARYGGEEFVLVLPSTALTGSMTIAERVRQRIESYDWPLRQVTVSIGCATLCDDFADCSSLLAAADRALYSSKQAGRNRVTASDSIKQAA